MEGGVCGSITATCRCRISSPEAKIVVSVGRLVHHDRHFMFAGINRCESYLVVDLLIRDLGRRAILVVKSLKAECCRGD